MAALLTEAAKAPSGPVRRIYENLGLLLGGKAAAGLISLVYVVAAARILGPEQYGVLVLVNYFAMLIGGLIAFPGWHAIVRYGVQPAETDHAKLIRLLRFAGAIELAAGVAAVVVAALAVPLVGPLLGWSADAQALAVPYCFAVLATVRATPGGYLQILRRFDLLALHNLVTPVMRLLGTLIIIFFDLGLTAFLVAWLVAALVEGASLWIAAAYLARRHMLDEPLLGAVADARREHEGLGRFMLTANADIMLGDLTGRLTPLIVGAMLGPAAAGLYSIAHRATIVISQPAQMLGQAAYAELARLAAGGGAGRAIRQALGRCLGIALATALPLLVILAFFSREIAVLIGGQAFAGAASVMLWLTLARVVAMTGPPTSAALIAIGRPGLSVTANMIAGLGLMPLLPLFTRFAGLVGAGYHALLQAVVAAGLLGFALWRVTDRPQ
ncbi:oligosaccharide flippase family protein [Sphingopyxis sp. OPL5]|uniref:lipopolysaccharide biosynthesis protein n=1 Tax=Sphingopyxis sp. OPL5 TaxID=2486273 RepID=UPI00164EA014|nr:oligosaccharide flippase family protein [Sphingopyxis sp. OPL5]QNO26249.1 oligosaccharide flippase family protein [Sphingopyxis sp. OPL5]